MADLFLTVLEISASVSFVIVLLLLVSPLLERRYASKWKYLIWIFLSVRLLVPFSGAGGRSAVDLLLGWKNHIISETEQKEADMVSAEPAPRRIVLEVPEQMTMSLAIQEEKSITLLDAAGYVWATGCILVVVIHIISYLHYRKQVMKTGMIVKDVLVLQDLLRVKRELHLKHTVPVVVFPEAASPMIMGFLKPVLILPEDDYSREELYFILKHELVHLKRGDICMKLLFMTAGAVHWFNPLIWIMQKEAVVDMELSCDEKVTQGADPAMRKAYTETLLSTLHKGSARITKLSTGFYGGKQIMKKRFQNILGKTGKKNGFYILACVVVLTLGAGTLVGCSVTKEETEDISEAEIEENEPVETEFAEMSGSWIIDFDRTDQGIWGTGISFGDSMEISDTGVFSYYIGIGVGGTGTCEKNNGVITVEIEPYQELSTEREILTLQYENDDGAEYILMDWHGEAVYWKRGALSDEEFTDGNGLTNMQAAEDRITLTIMKEGMTEEKQAVLTQENGYMLYLPEGEWRKEEADTWQAVVNEYVRLSVSHFESSFPIEQTLAGDGYAANEEGMTKEESGIYYQARLYETENEVWCLLYSYPVEAEEGWGREMPVIADTFRVLQSGEYIMDTGAAVTQVLGYITDLRDGFVVIDRQDWVTPESRDWKPEYDADAGFEVVDIAGGDVTYPVRSDCRYFVLENHQGESVELDAEAFGQYQSETEFPIFWSIELEDGEVISFAEWYRP